MVKVNNVKILRKTVLKEGYYSDGLSIILKEYNTNEGAIYKVFYYVHCEDRLMEYGQYNSYNEALNDYENIIVTYC